MQRANLSPAVAQIPCFNTGSVVPKGAQPRDKGPMPQSNSRIAGMT